MQRITDKLHIDLMCKLGHGAKSIVYKGKFEDRPVAIKQISCENVKDAEETLSSFQKSREKLIMNIVEEDRHPNIIGYYFTEIFKNSMYIALELCDGDLTVYIKREDFQKQYPPSKVNIDIASGVEFLHDKKIAHRDIKPENIYFLLKDNRITRIVIGDFGTSKTTVSDYFSMTSSGFGTHGYIAYEVMKKTDQLKEQNLKTSMSTKSDIFAMGCVFYFTQSKGNHPFGANMTRQVNIQNQKPPNVDCLEPRQYPLKVLLINMLEHDPDKRPTAGEVRKHPALWPPNMVMKFFVEVSDSLKVADSYTVSKFENPDVINGTKLERDIPKKLQNYLSNSPGGRRYLGINVRWTVYGVLRVIRNINNHFNELTRDVQEEVGLSVEDRVNFWMDLCPMLLMHIYDIDSAVHLPGVEYQYNRRQVAPVSARDEMRRLTVNDDRSETSTKPGGDWQTQSPNQKTVLGKVLPTKDATSLDTEEPKPRVTNIQRDINRPSLRQTDKTSDRTLTENPNGSDSHIPVVIRQTRKFYKPDMKVWSLYAREEIEHARQCGYGQLGKRHLILCLDISESMAQGNAWKELRIFVNDVLDSYLALATLLGNQQSLYIAVTTFGHEIKVIQRFTNNAEEIRSTINDIRLGGPTPIDAGLYLAAAAAGTPEGYRGMPIIAIISDFKGTDPLCYEGPDEPDENKQTEIQTQLIDTLLQFNEASDMVFVPVGDYDKNFLEMMIDVAKGRTITYKDGNKIITEPLRKDDIDVLYVQKTCLSHSSVSTQDRSGTQTSEKDRYKESGCVSLPKVGSRVVRGPDWVWEEQDGGGPGTVIGHYDDENIWVEWDAKAHQNTYRYGEGSNYDVVLSDCRREISDYGTLNVGCVVTKESGGHEKGVVIKILGSGRVEVRWDSGERKEYCFGQDGKYEVLPWTQDVAPEKKKNKNLVPKKKT